jgi:hypothetical protein
MLLLIHLANYLLPACLQADAALQKLTLHLTETPRAAAAWRFLEKEGISADVILCI